MLGAKGVQVRLGFAAPRNVAVHREEIYQRMRAGPTRIAQAGRGSFSATLRR